MRYRKPAFAIDYHAVEISRHVAGANKRSEKGGYVTMWVKEGVIFEHRYPENCVMREF
jgi:hypothetical protein